MHTNFILLMTIFLCNSFYSDFTFEKPSRTVDRVFIHCSDSDWKHHDDISVIRKWHVDENGWGDVGYHYFMFAMQFQNCPYFQQLHGSRCLLIIIIIPNK